MKGEIAVVVAIVGGFVLLHTAVWWIERLL
jgi:hypothetical protein